MPTKRHPSLIPLSREHHLGLLLAFRLCHGLPRTNKPADSPQEQAAETVRFFHESLVSHFRAEEEVLFPAIRICTPQTAVLLDTLTAEHVEMRARVKHLAQASRDEVTLLPLLRTFGELLERHIRREERELFPFYEANMSEEQATQIGAGIAKLIDK